MDEKFIRDKNIEKEPNINCLFKKSNKTSGKPKQQN